MEPVELTEPHDNYPYDVLYCLKNLTELDGIKITNDFRTKAWEYKEIKWQEHLVEKKRLEEEAKRKEEEEAAKEDNA